jgi:transcriptional regulator with XRE-family HTH domain
MAGVSETIVKLRTEKGWTQQELADRLVVSRSLVSMWELGIREPDLLSVEKMAGLFGVKTGAIVSGRSFIYFSQEGLWSIEEEIKEMTESDSDENETNERQTEILNSFLSHLNRKNRIIFTSRYLLMKTSKAIGDDLGMSENAVRIRLSRLRNEFKDFYKERRK